MTIPRNALDYQQFAETYAQDAHENYISSRRGTWQFPDAGVLVLYNNNPYAKYPAKRPQELAELRNRLVAAGIKELAFATYPPSGEPDAGYTFALVLKGGPDLADLERTIIKLWRHVYKAVWGYDDDLGVAHDPSQATD